MKVSAICPSCGRPAASKGRSECLYCGSPLEAIETGKVTAPGSGVPLPRQTAQPPSPRPTARKVDVPLLFEGRAARMQAEAANPIADFFRSTLGKVVVWVGSIAVVVGGLIVFIEDQTVLDINPKNYEAIGKGTPQDSPPGPGSRGLEQSRRQAEAATVRADARSALQAIATAIEKAGDRDGHYPDFVPSSLIGLEPGRDFAEELAHFAGGKILSYRRAIDAVTNRETFVVEAVSAETGEKLEESGSRSVTSGTTFEVGRDRDDEEPSPWQP